MSNDIETREIADSELDAVAGGIADVFVASDVKTAAAASVDVAGTELHTALGAGATSVLHTHI